MAALAIAPDEARPAAMAPRTFESLRDQAAMQVAERVSGQHAWKHLPPEPKRGFELLPEPSGGDLFFDIEGDPFWEPARGLEYLWGMLDTHRSFRPFWAHDRAQERRAVEGVIDLIREHRAADPAMHVYHYAAYEITALKRLTCEYGTREEELDELLRAEVFVDLYRVVSQGLRLSHPRYGLKQVETFYFEREADLRAGDDSILLYEDWLESHDTATLDAIADYNEEDCSSTLELRDWLLARRPDGAPPPEPKEPRDPPDDAAETEELRAALLAGLPDDPLEVAGPVGRAGSSPSSCSTTGARRSPPGGTSSTGSGDRRKSSRSATPMRSAASSRPAGDRPWSVARVALHVPPQQHHLGEGSDVHDPATGGSAGKITFLDDETGTLRLRRGPSLEGIAMPGALIPGGPYNTKVQQAALRGRALPARRGRTSPPPSRSSAARRSRPT